MNRWVGKVAVVTGASEGIGTAIVKDLARAGMKTIGLARNADKIEELRSDIPSSEKDNLIARKCDVTSEDEIKNTFSWIAKNYGGVDVFINNAGIFRPTMILNEDNSRDVTDVVKTNLMAPIFCIREAFKYMKDQNEPGHIIIINSIAGHYVGKFIRSRAGSLNVYAPTKFAITALNEVVRQELIMKKSKIKISSISPGNVDTSIVKQHPELLRSFPYLVSKDISDAVLYTLGTPEGVQVHELTIKPNGERY